MTAPKLKTPRTVKGIAPWVRIVREQGPTPYSQTLTERPLLNSPRAVWNFCRDMERLEAESFVVICLDTQHRVIARSEVTRGTLNASLVHPREVFRLAIALGAASVVLAHNHPSGNPQPSVDDRQITSQLVDAGRLLEIPVHDHIVIGNGTYVSFAECGMM